MDLTFDTIKMILYEILRGKRGFSDKILVHFDKTEKLTAGKLTYFTVYSTG